MFTSLRQTKPRREKTFGVRGVPLDRNAKVRLQVYLDGYNARHRAQGRQQCVIDIGNTRRQVSVRRRTPITRAYMGVFKALLWGFHNSRTGFCFPSYEAIAAKADCDRDTVCEAIKALELAGVLTWAHRLVRRQVRERDLFGRWSTRWRVVRASNVYLFRDPMRQEHPEAALARQNSKSDFPAGTQNQDISIAKPPLEALGSDLLRALHSLGCAIAARDGLLA